MARIAHAVAYRLQRLFMRLVHLDVGQERKVVARPQPVQMRLEVSLQCVIALQHLRQVGRILFVCEQRDSVAGEDRCLGRQGSGLFVRVGQLPRCDLAGFHVRLIEGIDAEDGTGHGRRELPAEELLAEVVGIVERNPHDRMPGSLQRLNRCVLGRIRRRLQSQIDEDAIAPVEVRCAERFPIDGDQPLSVFACRLCHQLFQPGAKIVDARRRDDRHFV